MTESLFGVDVNRSVLGHLTTWNEEEDVKENIDDFVGRP
jgi:hypothetical protein